MPEVVNTKKAAAESAQEPAQPVNAGSPSSDTITVTFSREFTLPGGPYEGDDGDRDFKIGDVAEIPANRAGEVLTHGYARPHDEKIARNYGLEPVTE